MERDYEGGDGRRDLNVKCNWQPTRLRRIFGCRIGTVRILIVTGIFPPDVGGPASYVPVIAEHLVTAGHEVRTITLADGKPETHDQFPFVVTRIPRTLPLLWRFTAVVRVLVAQRSWAELIYVNGLALESFVANLLMRKPLAAKVVGDWAWERATTRAMTTLTIERFQRPQHNPKLALLKFLRNLPLRMADRIIVPSYYLRRLVSGWRIDPSRLIVIYNSFECVAPADTARYRAPSDYAHLVTACRLVPWKGVDDLIRVVSTHQDWLLSVAGDGAERQRYESLAGELRCADRIRFHGNLGRHALTALMSTADAFVLNSAYEGLPHVVLEAFALGIPVVAADAGGTSEVVRDGDTGWLIPAASQAHLDAALTAVLSSPDRVRRAANALALLASQFTLQSMVEKTEDTLASASHARPGQHT